MNMNIKNLLENNPALQEFEGQLKVVEVLMGNAQKKLKDAVSSMNLVKEEIGRLIDSGPMKDIPDEFKQQIFGDILKTTTPVTWGEEDK